MADTHLGKDEQEDGSPHILNSKEKLKQKEYWPHDRCFDEVKFGSSMVVT